MEIRVKATIETVDRICTECGTGRMRPTGMLVSTVTPTLRQHRCNNKNCQYLTSFASVYPFIDYHIEEE